MFKDIHPKKKIRLWEYHEWLGSKPKPHPHDWGSNGRPVDPTTIFYLTIPEYLTIESYNEPLTYA